MLTTRYSLLAGALVLSCSLFAAPRAKAQAPAWQTALAVATTSGSQSYVQKSAADASGNVYLAGVFTGTITLGNTALVSLTTYHAFIAKWSSATNTFTWAQALDGTQQQDVNGLAVSGSTVYLGGSFSGQLVAGSQTLVSQGGNDIYVLKLIDAGPSATAVWAQRAGGAGYDTCSGLVVQGSAVYLSGQLDAPSATFGTVAVPSVSASSGCVAKLVDAGSSSSFSWAQVLGTTRFNAVNALAVQGSTVYALATYAGTLSAGSVVLPSPTNNTENSTVGLLKFSDQGSSVLPIWGQPLGGLSSAQGMAIVTSGSTAYIAGYYSGPTFTAGTLTLTNDGGLQPFLVKLTDAGTSSSFNWVQTVNGLGSKYPRALALRGSSLYVAGELIGQAQFGSTTLSSQGRSNAFVARLLDAGSTSSWAWGTRAGGAGDCIAYSLTLSGTQVVVGGSATNATLFGTQTITAATTRNYGFVASLTDATGLAVAPPTMARMPLPYPNPAHGYINVPVSPTAGTGALTLKLVDALGRLVRTQVVAPYAGASEVVFDLRGVVPGVYALRLGAGGTPATERLVVE